MSKLKITTIIPVYNCENYLANTIESILAQTYKNFEIILINDCSNDKSSEICNYYANKNDNIKYINLEKNKGVSNARNLGIKNSNGDYIHFMDSDDTLENDTYEKYIKILEKNKYDLILCGVNIWQNNKIIEKNVSNTVKIANNRNEIAQILYNLSNKGKERTLNVVWNKLYARKIIIDNKLLFDTTIDLGEDFVFNCKFFSHIATFYEIPNAFYNYVKRNSGNLSNKFRMDLLDRRKKMYNSWMNLYKSYNILDEKIANKIKNYEGFIMYHSLYSIFYKNCKLTIKEKKQFLKIIIDDEHSILILDYLKKGVEFNLIKKKKIEDLYKYLKFKQFIKNIFKK